MKKVLSYGVILSVVLLMSLGVLNAENNEVTEDYNFKVKAYKTDAPLNFMERYQSGEVQELTQNDTIYPGDVIAVGVYATTYNPVGRMFEITLDWNRDLLEQIMFDEESEGVTIETLLPDYPDGYGDMYGSFSSDGTFNKKISFLGGVNYSKSSNIKDTVLIEYRSRNTISKDGILYWYFFKVDEKARLNSKCNLSFLMAEGYETKGVEKVNITTTPLVLNVGLKPDFTREVGDLNNDGTIDFADYILMNKYTLNSSLLSEEDFKYADTNKDGRVDITDYVRLFSYLMRKINSFE